MPRYPRPKKPTPNFDPGSTSTVSSRVNTGQSSSSRQTTGATGSVSNRVTSVTKRGVDGAPGRTQSTTVTAPGTTSVSAGQIASTQQSGSAAALQQSVQAQANAIASQARAAAAAGSAGTNATVSSALDTIGSTLASGRQMALDAVRKAGAGSEWEKRVNDAFDEADKRVADEKKRRS